MLTVVCVNHLLPL